MYCTHPPWTRKPSCIRCGALAWTWCQFRHPCCYAVPSAHPRLDRGPAVHRSTQTHPLRSSTRLVGFQKPLPSSRHIKMGPMNQVWARDGMVSAALVSQRFNFVALLRNIPNRSNLMEKAAQTAASIRWFVASHYDHRRLRSRLTVTHTVPRDTSYCLNNPTQPAHGELGHNKQAQPETPREYPIPVILPFIIDEILGILTCYHNL